MMMGVVGWTGARVIIATCGRVTNWSSLEVYLQNFLRQPNMQGDLKHIVLNANYGTVGHVKNLLDQNILLDYG